MAERQSLTTQLQWALLQAERRKPSATAQAYSRESSLHSSTSTNSRPSGLPGSPSEVGYGYSEPLLQHASPASYSGGAATFSPAGSGLSNLYCGQGWDSEVVWDLAGGSPSTSQQQSQGSAQLEDMLFDEDIHMLDNLLAYQVIHNELADMIGDVSTQMESWAPPSATAPQLPPVVAEPGRNSDVESWVESLLNGTAAMEVEPFASSPHSLEEQAEVEVEASTTSTAAGEDKSLEEVTEMLLECGEAVMRDDVLTAHKLFFRVRAFSTPDGTHLQRMAHYFVEALMARLNGTGAELYTAVMKRDKKELLDAEARYMATDPTPAIAHHFSKSVLLEAFAGAERVHIIDYGILGHQWQSLMQALAYQPQGPPRLRITGIELPQPGLHPDGMVRETGRKLSRFAASLGIPFEFKGIAGKWEDVQISQLALREDEVLAVSSVFRLRHLLDDSVVLSNPRRTVLERICSMKPKVLVMADRSLAGNAPFLITRLREGIPSWYSFFDFLESTLPRDSVNRRMVEQGNFGHRILNMIACEGMNRRERPEAYHQWHWRLVNAGFQQLPLTETVLNNTQEVLKDYKSSWTIGRDQNWLLTGWKGTVHHCYSAWAPAVQEEMGE